MSEDKPKQSIYIAGPMRGYTDYNYPRFNHWAAALREEGWDVVNPVDLSNGLCKEWAITTADIAANKLGSLDILLTRELGQVRMCDAIFLLRGWEKSKGAREELFTALANDKKILLEGQL